MRYTADEVELAARQVALNVEHRLTRTEIGLEGLKMEHGRRLSALEDEADARHAAIVKGARGLLLLLLGIAIDLRLNGGAVLKLLFGASP